MDSEPKEKGGGAVAALIAVATTAAAVGVAAWASGFRVTITRSVSINAANRFITTVNLRVVKPFATVGAAATVLVDGELLMTVPVDASATGDLYISGLCQNVGKLTVTVPDKDVGELVLAAEAL